MNFLDLAKTDTFLIFSAVNLALAMVFRRNLTVYVVVGSLLIAFGMNCLEKPYEWLREFRPDLNPQLILVIYLASSAVILGFLSCFKRWRSVDRLIMTVCIWAVLVTTTLFHQVMVWQTLKAWEADSGSSLLTLLPFEGEAFKEVCQKRSLKCFTLKSVDEANIDGPLGESLHKIEADTLEQAETEGIAHHYGLFNDADGLRIAFVAYYADKNGRKIIVDEKGASRAHSAVREAFYTLDIFAHSVWLLGCIGLAFFHKRRFARKRSQINRHQLT